MKSKPKPVEPPDARDFATRIIADVVHRRLALDGCLEKLQENEDFRDLSPSDRGFTRALATSAIRGLGIIRKALHERLKEGLPPNTQAFESLMISGIAQILFLSVKDHAAVDTTVTKLRATPRLDRYAPLANAVLRGIARDQDAIRASIDPLRDNTPAWLAERWERAYGIDNARQIAEVHLTEPPLDITVKSDPEGWAEKLGGTILPGGTIRLPRAMQVTELPGFADGEWWVQDVSAAVPARLLKPQRGERILDLCAAPGGKTMQLAVAGAAVTAVDRSAPRMRRLQANLTRINADVETQVTEGTAFIGDAFDKILLDAPCSATGTIRRHPDVAASKTLADVAALTDLQARLLDHAWTLLRPGGMLVYATCSLEREEGENQIASFLQRTPTAVLDAVEADEIGNPDMVTEGMFRALPSHFAENGGCDGFFAARLRKR